MPNYPVYHPADVEAQLRRLKGGDGFDDSLLGGNAVIERARYYRKMRENPRGGGRLAPVGTAEMDPRCRSLGRHRAQFLRS